MSTKKPEEIYMNLQEYIVQLCKDPHSSRSMTLVSLNRIYTASEKLLETPCPSEGTRSGPISPRSPQRIMLQLIDGIEDFKSQEAPLSPAFLGFLSQDLLEAVREVHGSAFRNFPFAS